MSVRELLSGLLACVLAAPGLSQGAQWSVEPSAASIGEPCRMRLVIEHDADDSVLSPPKDFKTQGAAVRVLAGPTVSTVPSGEAGRAQTELVWSVMGIEPGTVLAPELKLKLATQLPLEWGQPVSFRVATELGPDEDASRPLPKPPGWDGSAPTKDSSAWMLGLLAAVLGGGLLLAWRRGRSSQMEAAAAVAVEQPAAILARLLAEEAGAKSPDVGYGVTQALRAATEALTERPEPAKSLDEWLLAQDQGGALLAEQLVQLAYLLERAEALTFGPAEGRLSQRELLSSAQDLVQVLASHKQELGA